MSPVAVITGGGTGIGAATAQRFAQDGLDVVVCGRRREPLEATAEGLAGLAQLGQGERATPLQAQYEALAADGEYWETKARRDAHVLACWALLQRLAAVYEELMDRRGWTAAEEEVLLAHAALIEKVLQRREGRKGSAKRDLLVSTHDPEARYNNREPGGIVAETSQLLRKVMFGAGARITAKEAAAALDLRPAEVRAYVRHLVPVSA